MARKCRKLTQEEQKTWNKIQQMPEAKRVKAEEAFVKKVMATDVKKFPKGEINFTNAKDALAREGVDTTLPSKTHKELTPAQVRENELIPGKPKYTLEQVDALVGFFGEYIENPTTQTAWELTKELRRDTRAGRAAKLRARAQQLVIEDGLTTEEAIKQAISETLAGKYPTIKTEYLSQLTEGLREALFSKVYHTLKAEPFEMASTITALTNALDGRPIPRDPGVAGKSAFTRLQRVFGEQPLVFKAIRQGAKKKQTLENVIEGVYREIGQPPIPIDPEMADYLRGLKDFGKAVPLFPLAPVSRLDKVVEATFAKILPNLTSAEKQTISRVLKELLMSPIDIANLIRANLASFDLSFWRQTKTLTPGHPINFYRGNVEAWKALWSEKAAEANWEWVKVQPGYPYYVDMAERTGNDFIRLLVAPKGTAQWQAAEEFGYLTTERWIPRMTAKIPWIKISGRHFVTGINTTTILIWNDLLKATLRRAELIASGQIKLKPGESFSIQQEMDDYGRYIADLSQRASLGRMKKMAPDLNALLFSARSKLGRFLTPRHLISSNPRVRALAWKDLGLFVAAFGGLVMLGKWFDLWDVDTDPRSGEYMSIRIGNLRIDPWGGNRQFLVLYARLATQTGVSSVTGAEYDTDPIRALTNFLRSSLAPFSSITMDFWTGKNFLGEDVDIADGEQWLKRIAPFAVQDVWEAFEEGWHEGTIAIVPAIFGEGVQTYSGDWSENFTKLGTPKYLENSAYGITSPIYDVKDFWSDTVSRFAGVELSEITESKGYPDYMRSIVEARNEIVPLIKDLPNISLYQMNANPSEGTTFMQYFQMWRDREKIVASGDEEALKAFDSNEMTRNAYLGNISQNDYALLVEYNAKLDEDKEAFLKLNPRLGSNPRENWLEAHPRENAILAVWGQEDVLTRSAYSQARKMIKDFDIPDSAVYGYLPSENIANDYFDFKDLIKSGVSANSNEARFWRLIRPEYDMWHKDAYDAEPIDPTLIERYGTDRVRSLNEQYDLLLKENGDPDAAARRKFREDNLILDAYFVYVNGYKPRSDKTLEITKDQFLEWYKIKNLRQAFEIIEEEGEGVKPKAERTEAEIEARLK